MNVKQLSVCAIVLFGSLTIALCFSNYSIWIKVLTTMISLFIIWISWKLIIYSVCNRRPYLHVLIQLLMNMCFYYLGALMLRNLRKKSKNVEKTQSEFLFRILKSNEKTLFGKDYQFKQIKSISDYKQNVPLSYPTDLSYYLNMICDGKQNILTSSQVSRLVSTSGTTGPATLLPYTVNQMYKVLFHFASIVCYQMLSTFPQAWRSQKTFRLVYLAKWKYTKAGVRYGPISSDPEDFKKIDFLCTTPYVGFEIEDERLCQYVHLVFALKERFVGFIESTFASVVWSTVLSLRSHWDEILSDIETGTLSEKFEIEPRIRSSLQARLQPDPKRARELREAIKMGRKGLFRRIWPTLNLVTCIDTGPFQIYRQHLLAEELFGIPIYCPFYGSSESILGLNMWPKQVCLSEDSDVTGFHLLPELVFYEFIPIDKMDEKDPETLLMHEVKENESYELVLTTLSGLCRYRISDVVRVIRKEGQCPVVEYLYRKNILLNVRSEKLNEDFFYRSLISTSSYFNIKLCEYCCVESPVYLLAIGEECTNTPYYIVFIELYGSTGDADSISKKLDEYLMNDMVYSSYRSSNSIGAPQVYLVKEGTFQNLRDHLLEVTEASPNQLKIPRVLKRESAIRFMRDNIM